jgi:hypothetical protein
MIGTDILYIITIPFCFSPKPLDSMIGKQKNKVPLNRLTLNTFL